MKKIRIFNTPSGGGHITVCKALQDYLKDEYEIQEVYTFCGVIEAVDPVMLLSFSRINSDRIYNFFLQKKWFLFFNFLYKFGRCYFKIRKKKIQNLLHAFLIKDKPELVISVVPLINNALILAAKELNIPCLIIPTDLDSQAFMYPIERPEYDNMRVTCPFDDRDILQIVMNAGFKADQIQITGFPLRSDFFEEKNVNQIKKDFEVVPHKPVIMLLMGAQGAKTMVDFSKYLAQIPIPVHLLICLGKLEGLQSKIERIPFPEHITKTIIGFTPRIADLLAISDIFVTKSGSVSVSEAIYSQVPMLLDATSTVLAWEQFNHTFIKKHGFGDIIESYNDIVPCVTQLLSDKNELIRMKENMKNFQKKRPDIEIPNLIKQMIS